MASAKLTQTFLSNIERPASGTLRIMDAELRGLCVDVGTKSIRFYLRRQFNGSTKPIKLGEFPAMTVSQARDAANALIAQAASGGVVSDRVQAVRRAPMLGDAMEAYIQFRASSGRKIKESTVKDLRQRLGLLKDWHTKRIVEITRADVSERHLSLTENNGPVAANGAMRWLSAVLNWSSDHYAPSEDAPLIPSNPVKVLQRKKQWNTEKRRQTFVQASDLPKLWEALHALPADAERWGDQAEVGRDFFLFCLFTGMRPGEAKRLHMDNVDLGRKVFVLKDSKNHTDFHLPFSSEVEKILTRRIRHAIEVEKAFVFPSLGHHGASQTVNLRHYSPEIAKKVPGFVPNDMRRTFTTIVTNMEPPVSHLTLKRLLNHTAVVVDATDVTAGYFATDVERLRPVVERVAQEILRRCGQVKDEKVVSIRVNG